ncbi:MAG: FapA family protein [Sulfuricurvum sp.]|nr:FapA family protein [Sulfuricurvum sp.]MDP3021689.1 FapA family protein [Sulfuricurvum sp.]
MHTIKITTFTVPAELKKIAQQWNLPVDAIDFDVLSYGTQYKGAIDEDWCTLDGNDLGEITTEVEIRSPLLLIRQEYQLLIRPLVPHPYFDFRFTMASDKYKSKLVAIVDPSSILPLKKGLQEYLKETINRKKLRSGFMIGITDGSLEKEINAMLLKIQKEGPLTEPYRLPIAHFFPPAAPINDNVILHYKKIQRSNNLLDGVEVDDLILEYILPQNGVDGRSCTGEYIHVGDPLIRYAKAINTDSQSIRAEEDHHSIRFYATKSGFVERKNGLFTISQDLHLKNASFKSTGSLEAGSEKEINIKIGAGEEGDDAVGSGVNIDVQTLDVKGTIGSNTKIQACEVTIGAQTHKKSFIEVEGNATIHLHRGNLKAKDAIIDILEAGTVEAQTVYVKSMSGGEIIAQRVIIDVLYSNAKITALESIEIKSIVGDGNDLIINPRAIPSYLEQITVLEDELARKQLELREKGKKYLQQELLLKEDRTRIQRTIENINIASRQNREPLKSDKERLTQYKSAVESLKNEAVMIKAQEDALNAFERKLDRLYEADLQAVVTHHKAYDGNTRVQFIDPKTRRTHSTSPKGNITHIRLHKEGDEKKFFFES